MCLCVLVCMGISRKNSFKGEECETLEKKSNYSENGTIIKLTKWLREALKIF